MNESIFRKQSLDRISSPEQLTDYIRVSNPRVWVVLSAVILLLISVLIWSVFGAMPSTLKVNTIIQNGAAICYVDSDTVAKLKVGMTVKVGEISGTIAEVSETSVSAEELSEKFDDEYTVTTLMAGQWNYPVKVNVSSLSDGLYEMVITTQNIKPISFILN